MFPTLKDGISPHYEVQTHHFGFGHAPIRLKDATQDKTNTNCCESNGCYQYITADTTQGCESRSSEKSYHGNCTLRTYCVDVVRP